MAVCRSCLRSRIASALPGFTACIDDPGAPERIQHRWPIRAHEGTVVVPASNQRWASEGLEIPCRNGEVVRVADAIDTPVSVLDVAVQRQVLQLLRDVQPRRGLALLFITHDLEVLAHLDHEVMVMRHGWVVERGATGRVLMTPEADYTRDLVAAIPRLPHGAAPVPLPVA